MPSKVISIVRTKPPHDFEDLTNNSRAKKVMRDLAEALKHPDIEQVTPKDQPKRNETEKEDLKGSRSKRSMGCNLKWQN